MGRRHMSGRDKWQYYTISNTGNLNTKLPISVNGKSCTSEYGCDQIMNGDSVYVEGYKNTFKATVYENNMFSYIPVV
jgi:ferredoxin-NADP reductase